MHQELGYLDKIKEGGYRLTPQRQLILDTLCQLGSHVTAVAIYEQAQQTMPALNQATVYRTLDFFCDLKIVAKTDITGQSVYELLGDRPHHHLVCRECQAMFSFDAHHLEELAAHIEEEHGFKPDFHHLVISGLCAACQEESK